MVLKLLTISLFSLCFGTTFSSNVSTKSINTFNNEFNIVSETDGLWIESVKTEFKNARELRIYGNAFVDSPVVGIKDGAFDGCTSLNSLMISSSVQNISSLSLRGASNLSDLYLTKSTNEFPNKTLLTYYNVTEYAFSEGFENYWKINVRDNDDENLCDKVNKDLYQIILSKYSALSLSNDLEFIKNRIENHTANTTYGEAMNILSTKYGEDKNPKSKDINKAGILTFILIVASFGMTAIGVFYFLKDKQIIS